MFSIMPVAAKSSRLSSSFFPNRLCRAAALFAVASTSSSPPFAASFSALASSSAFSRQTPSGQAKDTFITTLGSTTTDEQDSATTTTTTTMTDTTTRNMTPASKLAALRSNMEELNLDVYIIPSDDPHLSGQSQIYAVVWHRSRSLLLTLCFACSSCFCSARQNMWQMRTSVESSCQDLVDRLGLRLC